MTLRRAGLEWDEYFDHDSLDALAAALTAWRFQQGRATPFGDPREGLIWLPVRRPRCATPTPPSEGRRGAGAPVPVGRRRRPPLRRESSQETRQLQLVRVRPVADCRGDRATSDVSELAQGVVALDGRREQGPNDAPPLLHREVVAVDEPTVFEPAQLVTDGTARESERRREMRGSARTGPGDAVEQRVESRLGAPRGPGRRHGVLCEETVVPAGPDVGERDESQGVLDGRDDGVAEGLGEPFVEMGKVVMVAG